MQVLITNIIAIFGFIFIGWKLRECYAQYQLHRLLKTVQTIDEIEPQKIPKIKVLIERNKDMFYLYNKETDVFLAQGTNRKEIQTYLEKTYPNTSFQADMDNVKKVKFK